MTWLEQIRARLMGIDDYVPVYRKDLIQIHQAIAALSTVLDTKVKLIMSDLTARLDRMEAQNKDLARIVARQAEVAAQIKGLTEKIAELEAKLLAGTITPEELARMDRLQDERDALQAAADPTDPTVLPS